MKRVVIVGGGFGGIRTALQLSRDPDFEIKLIADQSYFEYHAALYRSATGRSPLEVAIPLEDFFKKTRRVEVINDRIDKLDSHHKTVGGSSGSAYHYDVLVLAL